MKRTITITEDDGSGRSSGGGGQTQRQPAQGMNQLAAQGQHGDTRLAHVNPFEEALLKALGGVGTKNPKTGLRQFYTPADTKAGLDEWYKQAFGRVPAANEVQYWYDYAGDSGLNQGVWDAFRNAGTNETYSGWIPEGYTNTQANTGSTSGTDFFDLPLDQYPYSTSLSNSTSNSNATNSGASQSQNYSTSGSVNTSDSGSSSVGQSTSLSNAGNQSQQASQSYSGLPANYQEALLSAVIPQLTSSIGNIRSDYDDYTNQALNSYQMLLNNALQVNVPKVINSLANRGIISSTAGSDALGKVMSDAALETSTKGYETAMQNAILKANIPSILAQIAELGKTSTGTSTGSSSGYSTGTSLSEQLANSFGNSYGVSSSDAAGTSSSYNSGSSNATSNSNSSSYTADPSKMYVTMAELIAQMMGS